MSYAHSRLASRDDLRRLLEQMRARGVAPNGDDWAWITAPADAGTLNAWEFGLPVRPEAYAPPGHVYLIRDPGLAREPR